MSVNSVPPFKFSYSFVSSTSKVAVDAVLSQLSLYAFFILFSLTYLLQGLWEAQIDLRLSLCGHPHRKCLCNGFYMSAVKADEDPALSAASVNTVLTSPSRKRSAPFNPCRLVTYIGFSH